MTTYGFNLNLNEQEFWAIKEAIEFYLTSEAGELRKKNPHLVKYASEINLRKILKAREASPKISHVMISRSLLTSVPSTNSEPDAPRYSQTSLRPNVDAQASPDPIAQLNKL